MAININRIVDVTTSVISGAIAQPALITNFLTENVLVPAGGDNIVLSFKSLKAVGEYFGTNSDEYAVARNYFFGYTNSRFKPQQILFSSYPQESVSAYMISQPITSATTVVNAIKALTSPALTCTINGTSQVLSLSQSDFASVTSLSNISSIIQNKLNAVLPDCGCLIVGNNQFLISAPLDQAQDTTITFATGNVAVLLGLDIASAPILSQGTSGGNADFNMGNILDINNNFIAISYVIRLSGDEIEDGYPVTVDLASWLASQQGTGNYIGLFWEGGTQPYNLASTTNLANVLVNAGYGSKVAGQITFNTLFQLSYNGVLTINLISENEIGRYSAFVGGMGASIRYNVINGKINFAGKRQDGLATNVSNTTIYDNLLANGYNVYGSFASRTTNYDLTENGSIGSDILWIDNAYDEVYLTSLIQNSLATLISNAGRIPYNQQGISQIISILDGVAQNASVPGVIETGNTFNQIEIQEMIDLVGFDISSQMTQNGYYVYIVPPTADARINRVKVQGYFLYTNGGAINGIGIGQVLVM